MPMPMPMPMRLPMRLHDEQATFDGAGAGADHGQNARKKLETRRLAYDTSLAKMQKTKKEDFRMEEELRAQKAKYEETSEDVFRRMQDIKEAEVDMVQDLTAFLEAELSYYDRCREILINVKREWPVRQAPPHPHWSCVLTPPTEKRRPPALRARAPTPPTATQNASTPSRRSPSRRRRA